MSSIDKNCEGDKILLILINKPQVNKKIPLLKKISLTKT